MSGTVEDVLVDDGPPEVELDLSVGERVLEVGWRPEPVNRRVGARDWRWTATIATYHNSNNNEEIA